MHNFHYSISKSVSSISKSHLFKIIDIVFESYLTDLHEEFPFYWLFLMTSFPEYLLLSPALILVSQATSILQSKSFFRRSGSLCLQDQTRGDDLSRHERGAAAAPLWTRAPRTDLEELSVNSSWSPALPAPQLRNTHEYPLRVHDELFQTGLYCHATRIVIWRKVCFSSLRHWCPVHTAGRHVAKDESAHTPQSHGAGFVWMQDFFPLLCACVRTCASFLG